MNNSGTTRYDNYEPSRKYALMREFIVGIATRTPMRTLAMGSSTTCGASQKWNQVKLQSVHTLSKRTDVYLEGVHQHATDHNYAAFINTSSSASSTADQVAAAVGLRTRFQTRRREP
ncbi:hypothetical protein Q8F57_046430 [Paraburkholderia terrae]|uniref:hypothetical protein n=1 Tax=Paraburkholderia terrae TaxID=311230 RepID=UPI00296B3A0A|nr:hypothetical protein [Paraburkholderia terrae]MDW3658090.1 hypothetical protein [Paraburkholderia terrae]